MHLKRLITAFVLVPFLYFYVMYLPPYFSLFLITFFSTLALSEFYAMTKVEGLLRYSGLFWGAVILTVFFFSPDMLGVILLLSVLATMALRLFIIRDPSGSIAQVSFAVLGLIYLPGLLTFQLSIIRAAPAFLVMLFAAVWGSDSLAFYIGKGIGKRKLYFEVSPNKTVEGAIGSFIGGIAGSVLIKMVLLQYISFPKAILLGLAVGAATIIGDLVESMFKRDVGVKDSGAILPGHGGLLDKLDSVTFAGPVFYWVSRSLGIIG